MHDGQNLFDAKLAGYGVEWGIDEHVSALAKRGIGPAIVVGIANSPLRWREYAPASIIKHLSPKTRALIEQGYGGPPLSAAYLRFIVEELKPWVDKHYRTRPEQPHTLMMGSSMGGLITLEAMATYPNVFSGAGCLSSHLSLFAVGAKGPVDPAPWAKDIEAALRAFAREDLPPPEHHRFWLDHGTLSLDQYYGPFQDALVAGMVKRGYRRGQDLVARTYPGATHNEASWSARVEQPLTFLLGGKT